MGYLEQFAKNRRRREKTEVLTARLPESLYEDFKGYCDELGLSISEAVCLLVEHEIQGIQGASEELATTYEYKTNDEVVIPNTKEVKKPAKRINTNSNRFVTKQWQVDGQLPCPYCSQWIAVTNFSRHAKRHATTTEDIFSNDKFTVKIDSMIAARKIEEGK